MNNTRTGVYVSLIVDFERSRSAHVPNISQHKSSEAASEARHGIKRCFARVDGTRFLGPLLAKHLSQEELVSAYHNTYRCSPITQALDRQRPSMHPALSASRAPDASNVRRCAVLLFFTCGTLIVDSIGTIRCFAILNRDVAVEVSPSGFRPEDRFHCSQDADDGVHSDLDGTIGAEVGELESRI